MCSDDIRTIEKHPIVTKRTTYFEKNIKIAVISAGFSKKVERGNSYHGQDFEHYNWGEVYIV